jgi:transcriptional regulator with XRE-family HTH domain
MSAILFGLMITDREKEICDRLRRFREILQIPRTKFALTVGINSERLYTYEAGKAQIRYDTFAAVQKQFSINPVWLATGNESPAAKDFSDEKFREQIKPRELFSSVYDRLLERYLTMERVNKSGSSHLLSVAAMFLDPKVLTRLKEARIAAGISLAALAETFTAALRTPFSEKDFAAVERGKPFTNQVWMGAWFHELRINEGWLASGNGEMFEVPDWQRADYLAAIKRARLAAGLTFKELEARLRAQTTARFSAKELKLVERGQIMLTDSLRIGLPHVLGVEMEQLFPRRQGKSEGEHEALKRCLEQIRTAQDSLSIAFRELERRVSGNAAGKQ